MNARPQSEALFQRAIQSLPGGVNSPVRAFRGVGGNPLFVKSAKGAHLQGHDGQSYIDYVMSWGPMILGHAHPDVQEAIANTLKSGTSFGWATELEVELAEKVISMVPALEMLRFVNSGTEATMSAIRLARAFTKRDKIIKFAGCYHGHADAFLSDDAGSGLATLGIPGSAGVPEGAAKDTLTLPYNDLEAVEQTLKTHPDVAAIIIEPVAGNMGLVQPNDGYLQGLRKLCEQNDTLLIFDEVMTGFRLARGGAQERFDIRPDLSTFGKVIGGGLPVGAYGGRRDIMNLVAPTGGMYQAGTLSGNPLAMSAGLATLKHLEDGSYLNSLETIGQYLEDKINVVLDKHQSPAYFTRIGSMFYLWFKKGAEAAPTNYNEVKTGNAELFGRFFWKLLDQGIALAPSAFEVGFLSLSHNESVLDQTVEAIDIALKDVDIAQA